MRVEVSSEKASFLFFQFSFGVCHCSPLENPLKLDNQAMYETLCENSKVDHMALELTELAQARREDWVGNWVKQMIRIAKPGAPVIVESVPPPFCTLTWDWGGVDKDFWPRAVNKYGWDVDPTSFSFADDTIFYLRHHVAMRKLNSRVDTSG